MTNWLLIIFLTSSAHAHEGHHDGAHSMAAKTEWANHGLQDVYAEIDTSYKATVEPIFNAKCSACHSNSVASPWYSSIPLAGLIVEKDRNEAKEHLEISGGFPFAGHGAVDEDIKAIVDTINKGSMPPQLYTLFHPSSRLTSDEKKAILAWAKEAQNKISKFHIQESEK